METLRYTRGKLPHWEVAHGRYFVTVRCADSLPLHVIDRLKEIHRSLAAVEPQGRDFVDLQRRYFSALEKYLDAGAGSCPLRNSDAAQIVVAELHALETLGVQVPHYTIMPNHWHPLVIPDLESPCPLQDIMKRVKGRSGKAIRKTVGGRGPFWQREWFDRWMRSDGEWNRCVSYIRNNPIKAGLLAHGQKHRWAC